MQAKSAAYLLARIRTKITHLEIKRRWVSFRPELDLGQFRVSLGWVLSEFSFEAPSRKLSPGYLFFHQSSLTHSDATLIATRWEEARHNCGDHKFVDLAHDSV